ncbi:MAG: hypothetical protein JJE30_03635 [Desulfuromonadales bacterium]|nr:hypothetical protein [Desulfuromonadales bacterium]
MFVSFLYPFRIRNIEAPFLWIFYRQLAQFKHDEITYLGSPDYFVDPSGFGERWEFNRGAQENLGYSIPTKMDLDVINKRIIDHPVFDDLSKLPTANSAWKHLITERHEGLEKAIETHLADIIRQHPVEAILTWCNCRSLSVVAEKYGIPVIHNEQGPTRSPHYTQTAYLDFSGVNGHTEAHSRFLRFKAEVEGRSVQILSKKELLYLFVQEHYLPELISEGTSRPFDMGLALQIEDDSNVIAYGKGYNNFELIHSARKLYNRDAILIRRHPRGHLEYKENLGVIDDSPNVFAFFKKCRRIATVNSSVGLEALLFDMPTFILGDSPFSFMTNNRLDSVADGLDINDQLLALNFILFGYLIPYELLFNVDYYRWRLAERSEIEIFQYHQNYYQAKELTDINELEMLPGKDVFIYAIDNKVRRHVQHAANQATVSELKLKEKIKEAARLNDDIANLKQRNDELTGQLKGANEQIQQRLGDITYRDGRIREIQEDLDRAVNGRSELEERLHQLCADVADRDGRIKQLAEEMVRSGEQKSGLETRLEQKTIELAERERDLAENGRLLAEEMVRSGEQKSGLETRLEKKTIELTERERDLADHGLMLAEKDKLINNHSAELAELDKQLNQLKEELSCAGALQAELEKWVDHKSVEIVSRDERIKQLRAEIALIGERRAEMEDRLAQKSVELADLDARLAQLVEELARAAELRAELEKWLDHRSLELVSRDELIIQLKAEIDLVGEYRLDLESKLNQKTIELAERNERIRQIEEEVALEGQRLEEHLRRTDEQLAGKERQLQTKDRFMQEQEALLLANADELRVREAELASFQEARAVEKLEFERRIGEMEERIKDLLNSKSWKITAPLRKALDLFGGNGER